MRMRFGHFVLLLTIAAFLVVGLGFGYSWLARARLSTPDKIRALARARDFASAAGSRHLAFIRMT